jgi:transposase
VVFRLLSDRRDDLVAERTRTLSRLHVLLADLHPGGAKRELSATHAAAVLRQVRPITAVDAERKRIADQLLADVRRLDQQVTAASQAIRTAVREHGTTLTEVFGVGPILAAKLLGHAGPITRFPSRDHFASYTGTAPVEASSGDVRRHRLNRGGNRQLNTALHLIAVCQIRDPGPGQAYYQRKLAQAKTPEEARRSSNATSPTSSMPVLSPTTDAEPPRVDTQRRYQVTADATVGRAGRLPGRSTDRTKGTPGRCHAGSDRPRRRQPNPRSVR